MGSSNPQANQSQTYDRSVGAYNRTLTPSPLEQEFAPHAQGYQDAATAARATNVADYGRIQGGYQDFMQNLGSPTKFSFRNVSAQRPAELGESYGYLREAMPGYRDFAQTGGYSGQDIQELRARGVSPIRTAYGNTMRELDRSRALGGNGGSPNYIAAASRAQRDLPGQMADATTTVNAGLADSIRQGKMFGLGGMTNTGSVMGGLSSQEANRMLQADMANQSADIQTQGMGEASRWSLANANLAGLGGQTSLYGTTPAMSATFGNQALNAYGQRFGAEQARNQQGLGFLGMQTSLANQQANQPSWWEKLLQGMGSAAPYMPGGGGKNNGAPTNPGSTNPSQYNPNNPSYYNPNDNQYYNAGDPSNYGGNNAQYPVWGGGSSAWDNGFYGGGNYSDPSGFGGNYGNLDTPPPSYNYGNEGEW